MRKLTTALACLALLLCAHARAGDEDTLKHIFQRDSQGQVAAFVDRREGEDIRWERVPQRHRNTQLEH